MAALSDPLRAAEGSVFQPGCLRSSFRGSEGLAAEGVRARPPAPIIALTGGSETGAALVAFLREGGPLRGKGTARLIIITTVIIINYNSILTI